jgi:hypothetical protein
MNCEQGVFEKRTVKITNPQDINNEFMFELPTVIQSLLRC